MGIDAVAADAGEVLVERVEGADVLAAGEVAEPDRPTRAARPETTATTNRPKAPAARSTKADLAYPSR